MKYFAGLDWGSEQHAACVIDEQGSIVARFDVKHTAEGLKEFLAQLAQLPQFRGVGQVIPGT